jgi:hypothetical protein
MPGPKLASHRKRFIWRAPCCPSQRKHAGHGSRPASFGQHVELNRRQARQQRWLAPRAEAVANRSQFKINTNGINTRQSSAKNNSLGTLFAHQSASLIGRLGSSAFRVSTSSVAMSLTCSCFSSESARFSLQLSISAASNDGTFTRSPPPLTRRHRKVIDFAQTHVVSGA